MAESMYTIKEMLQQSIEDNKVAHSTIIEQMGTFNSRLRVVEVAQAIGNSRREANLSADKAALEKADTTHLADLTLILRRLDEGQEKMSKLELHQATFDTRLRAIIIGTKILAATWAAIAGFLGVKQ